MDRSTKMRVYYRKPFFFFVVASALWAYAFSAWAVNVTTIILPNGGECLTVGVTYTVSFSYSGADVEHIALYYKTDGVQPTHLDGTEIKHPINVPQQGTTFNWKPTSSHISETGRIWVDAHGNGHNSLSTWDSSNADFAVRSNCAAAATPVPAARVPKVPQPPAGFQTPAKQADVIPSTSAARLRFESPWARGEYRVRLVEERDGQLINLAAKDAVFNPGDIIEFPEFKLKPNTFHKNKRYIYAYDFVSSSDSVLSEVMQPFWTLTDRPRNLTVSEITATSAILTLLDEVPNLDAGLTGILFEELNSKYSSGWQSLHTWKVIDLEPDTQYQFWVKLRNGGGIENQSRDLVTFRTLALPPSGPSFAEVQTQKVEELKERVEKITKVVTGFQELALLRAEEAKKETEEEIIVEELPPPELPKLLAPEIPEKKEIVEAPPPEPARPPQKFVVTFDGENFNPGLIEIRERDTVEWRNNSSREVWPAVDPHPTHTGLFGLDAYGFLLAGEFYRFTFRNPGIWSYHDHSSAEKGKNAALGSIVVLPRPVPKVTELAEKKVPAPLLPPTVVARKVRRPPRELPIVSPVLGEELRKLAEELLIPITPLPPAPAPAPPRPPQTFAVFFADGKFKPQILEINSGDTVRFINETDRSVWPAVDPHPTHTGLSGFDALGDLLRGEVYKYTFTQAGTWTYHNHTVARAGDLPEAGVIIVKP